MSSARSSNISADESVLGADGIDFGKFRPISFEPAHNGYHVLGERVGSAFKDGAGSEVIGNRPPRRTPPECGDFEGMVEHYG